MDVACPRCGARVVVRLGPGEVCPSCASAEAWDRHGVRPLVLDRDSIDEAVRRREGEEAGATAWQRVRPYLPTALAICVGAAALLPLLRLLRAVPVGPLAVLRDEWIRLARWATVGGAAAILASVCALLLLRRSRLFRAWPLLAANLLAAGAGVAAAIMGPIHWHGAATLFGWEHVAMPALRVAATPLARAAMDASAVVLAPDADGDMRGLAIGAGAVIGRSADRAWVLTNSHVAIPYLPPGAFRDPRTAQPVWVYFADGRNARGRIRWVGEPPLDVALVSVPLEAPPPPVEVAPDAGGLGRGAAVFFVPNPFRRGWRSDHGEVVERRVHRTPAGEYSLVLTNLPLQQGDSGSGLFDATGRLVGINTWAILTADGRPTAIPRGISLPSNVLRQIMEVIRDNSFEELETPR